jgi:transcriptional regulator with XRE-family HTH domain
MSQIGQRIRQLRKDRKLTQEELAALVGVNQTHISHWENDVLDLSTEQVVKLARIFDITTDQLLLDGLEVA